MGVISTNRSTKTFANAEAAPVADTGNAPSQLSTQDMKALGADNVGELLNKLADPNHQDPSKKMRAVGSDKLDKDAFFKLMLAQIKNQDPSSPLKSHEMAAQLASFSGLEQMQNMNTTLMEMKNAQKPMEGFQALNFIGKAVSGDSAKVIRAKGDKDHDFKFELRAPAQKLELRVRNNDTGETIRTVTLNNLKEGENKFVWNGLNDKGQPAPTGNYQFFAEATSPNGTKMEIKTDFEGIISGVNYTNEGPVVLVGNQSVRLRDIKKIQDPSLMRNDQKINSVVESNLKKDGAVKETDNKQGVTAEPPAELQGAPEATPQFAQNLMDTVGMSREMMEKVAKETKN